MNKNTITGIVLMLLVVLIFSWYNQPSAEQVAEMKRQDSIATVMNKQAEMTQKDRKSVV